MASVVSRGKLEKLLVSDLSAQAAIGDAARIAALVREQARASSREAPLIDAAARLFDAARTRGLASLDMIAVLQPTQIPATDVA
jgi:3-hydroxyisobutyrate dehydrogenase